MYSFVFFFFFWLWDKNLQKVITYMSTKKTLKFLEENEEKIRTTQETQISKCI